MKSCWTNLQNVQDDGCWCLLSWIFSSLSSLILSHVSLFVVMQRSTFDSSIRIARVYVSLQYNVSGLCNSCCRTWTDTDRTIVSGENQKRLLQVTHVVLCTNAKNYTIVLLFYYYCQQILWYCQLCFILGKFLSEIILSNAIRITMP